MKRVVMALALALSILGSASVVQASSGSSDATTTTTTVLVDAAPVPAKSGSGRRIVYANRLQRVWVINSDNEVIRTFLVSGMLGQPGKGTFAVSSKSPVSYSPEFAGALVRTGGIVGFHEIPTRNGKPMQTVDELGTFKGSGCLRSSTQDARFIYQWATLGTKVVVVP